MSERAHMRILLDILLAASLFLSPWWVVFIVSIVGVIFFEFYWEIVLSAIVLDVLYSMPLTQFFESHFVHTYASIVILTISQIIQPYLR